MKKATKILTIAIAIMVGATFCFMTESASAASKPGKTTISSAQANGSTSATVKWKKTKGAKGYELRQNGSHVRFVNGTSATVQNLSPGTSYSFKVRAYKNTKTKQYYNKKTGKWQKKKPKGSAYGGKRYVKAYGKFSKTLSVTTAAAPKAAQPTVKPGKPASVTSENTSEGIKVTASPVQGANGYRFYCFDYEAGASTIKATQAGNVFIDRSVVDGKQYQYAVCAYKTFNGSQVFGDTKWSGKIITANRTTSPTGGGGTTTPVSPTTPEPDNFIQTRGGKVYPSADGTFTVTKGSAYTDPVKINGVDNPFSAIYTSFPEGTTFRLNAAELARPKSDPYQSQNGYLNSNTIKSISNKAVAKVFSGPVDIESSDALIFLTAGETNITFSNGKTMKFIVTGENSEANFYVGFVNDYVKNNSRKSDYAFITAATEMIYENYPNNGICISAMATVKNNGGNCWGQSCLLHRLCVERGLTVQEVAVYIPDRPNASHRMCIVTANGTEYCADANVGLVWTKQEYLNKYPDRTLTVLNGMKAVKW